MVKILTTYYKAYLRLNSINSTSFIGKSKNFFTIRFVFLNLFIHTIIATITAGLYLEYLKSDPNTATISLFISDFIFLFFSSNLFSETLQYRHPNSQIKEFTTLFFLSPYNSSQKASFIILLNWTSYLLSFFVFQILIITITSLPNIELFTFKLFVPIICYVTTVTLNILFIYEFIPKPIKKMLPILFFIFTFIPMNINIAIKQEIFMIYLLTISIITISIVELPTYLRQKVKQHF